MSRFFATFLSVLAAGALFSAVAAAQDAHTLQVQSAWARASLTPKGAGAAYLTIRNTGSSEDRLIGAKAHVSNRADLHTHIITDGVARMRPVEAVPVPGGGMTMLKPGGHHVMLRGLGSPLKEGDTFPLTLVFEKAGEMVVEVQVLAATATGSQEEHDHGAHGMAAESEHADHDAEHMAHEHAGNAAHGHDAEAVKSEGDGHDHAAHDHGGEAAPMQQHAEARPTSIPANLDVAAGKLSVHAKFDVEVTSKLDHVTINNMHAWTVRIRGVDGKPVENAKVHVTGGMPMHGHGLPTAPQVTEYLGDGSYLLEGVRFNMAGWWEVTLAIDSGHQQDTVTFNLLLN